MRVDIITCLPGLIESPFQHSIMKRAKDKGLVEVEIHDLRNFSKLKHRSVDDYAFGGGAGMVLMCEPIFDAVEHLQQQRTYDEIIFLTPDGKTLDQPMANGLSLKKNLILICGHYKGIDERIRQTLVTKEISIGDYVLSGGELAAAVLCDALFRLIPGVLNDETSALTDSFQDNLLSAPVYTRPADFRGIKVPEVLLSGHEKNIETWRFNQAMQRTKERRPDLLQNLDPSNP
jgi:tRNA (guanine37-N1)-methyltransferase